MARTEIKQRLIKILNIAGSEAGDVAKMRVLFGESYEHYSSGYLKATKYFADMVRKLLDDVNHEDEEPKNAESNPLTSTVVWNPISEDIQRSGTYLVALEGDKNCIALENLFMNGKRAWYFPDGTEVLTEISQEITHWAELPKFYKDNGDEYDRCYECTGYGDDYSIDENGQLISNCEGCPYNREEKPIEKD